MDMAEPQNLAEQAMVKAGEPLVDLIQQDYFGFDEVYQVVLPDNLSWVQHRALNEGAKRNYLNKVNNEITIRRQSKDASVKAAPGDERHALITAAMCGWNLVRGGVAVPFTTAEVAKFLEKAPPRVVDVIEKDIRLKNPWLLADMEIEDIQREIDALTEMRDRKIEEAEGKDH